MRDNAVTYAKAVAIILMVTGHACAHTGLEQWINMFHVPIFYFMSGFCFKDKYIQSFRQFALSKVKGLYWPFVKWGLFFVLIHNVLFSIGIYNSEYGFENYTSYSYSIRDILINMYCVVARMSCSERLLGGYWFLKCLFFGSFIFYAFVKVLGRHNRKMTILGGAILILLSFFFNYYDLKIYVVNYQDFQSAFFIWCGYYYKSMNISLEQRWPMLPLGLLIVTLGSLYWPGAAVGVSWQNQIPFMLTAVIGTIAVFGLCRRFERSELTKLQNILEFIGNNTLTILTWHFSAFVVVNALLVHLYSFDPNRIAEFPVISDYQLSMWVIAYITVGVVLPLGLAYINKYIKSTWLKF